MWSNDSLKIHNQFQSKWVILPTVKQAFFNIKYNHLPKGRGFCSSHLIVVGCSWSCLPIIINVFVFLENSHHWEGDEEEQAHGQESNQNVIKGIDDKTLKIQLWIEALYTRMSGGHTWRRFSNEGCIGDNLLLLFIVITWFSSGSWFVHNTNKNRHTQESGFASSTEEGV